MIRIVVMVLIAANLLYFGWSRWVDRDRQQLTAVAAAPAKVKPAPVPAAATPAAPSAPPPCATLGPFGSEMEAAAAEKQLTTAGWGVMRREVSTPLREGYWVFVANQDSLLQARTLDLIRRAGIQDAFAMPEDPQFRVSVGIFTEENRAEDRAARVQKLKLDAVVAERTREQLAIWLDVPGVARETLADGRLNATGLQLERLRIETCPPMAAPAAGSAPATIAGAGSAANTATAPQK